MRILATILIALASNAGAGNSAKPFNDDRHWQEPAIGCGDPYPSFGSAP